jgi:hypothetical protein
MDDDADSLRERDPFYEHRPVPLGAPVGKPRTTWRDVVEFLLGERTCPQESSKQPLISVLAAAPPGITFLVLPTGSPPCA